MSDETADTIDAAADYIEKHGWVHDTFENQHGVCATRALWYGAGFTHADVDLMRTLESTMKRAEQLKFAHGIAALTGWIHTYDPDHAPDRGISTIIGWNDHEDQTEQGVLDGLRAAAKDQRDDV